MEGEKRTTTLVTKVTMHVVKPILVIVVMMAPILLLLPVFKVYRASRL